MYFVVFDVLFFFSFLGGGGHDDYFGTYEDV